MRKTVTKYKHLKHLSNSPIISVRQVETFSISNQQNPRKKKKIIPLRKSKHFKRIPRSWKFSSLKISSRFAKLYEESIWEFWYQKVEYVATSLGTDIASLSVTITKQTKTKQLMATGRYFSNQNSPEAFRWYN